MAKYAADNVCLYDWRQHQERAENGYDLGPSRQIINTLVTPGATLMTDFNMNLHRLSHKRSFAPSELPRKLIPRMAHQESHTHMHTRRKLHNEMNLLLRLKTRDMWHTLHSGNQARKKQKILEQIWPFRVTLGDTKNTILPSFLNIYWTRSRSCSNAEFCLWDLGFFFFLLYIIGCKISRFSNGSWHTTSAGSHTG